MTCLVSENRFICRGSNGVISGVLGCCRAPLMAAAGLKCCYFTYFVIWPSKTYCKIQILMDFCILPERYRFFAFFESPGPHDLRDSAGASQMPPRCLPDVSLMPPRCLPDASQMPPSMIMIPRHRFLFHDFLDWFTKNLCLGSHAGVTYWLS